MSDDRSAYSACAPSYDDAEVQKTALDGRLKVAMGIRDRAIDSGNEKTARRWSKIVDELLDRRLEVRGL